MKITLRLLLISVCFIICSSCSKDEVKAPVVGVWELVGWTVDIPFELDDNIISSSNFLDKTVCEVNEILVFDSNGNVTSHDTFSPKITISLKDGTSDVYFVEEVCAEGSIGFSTSYLQVDHQSIELNGATGFFTAKELNLVYSNAVEIYNEARTEVIENKNLTLTYLKR